MVIQISVHKHTPVQDRNSLWIFNLNRLVPGPKTIHPFCRCFTAQNGKLFKRPWAMLCLDEQGALKTPRTRGAAPKSWPHTGFSPTSHRSAARSRFHQSRLLKDSPSQDMCLQGVDRVFKAILVRSFFTSFGSLGFSMHGRNPERQKSSVTAVFGVLPKDLCQEAACGL